MNDYIPPHVMCQRRVPPPPPVPQTRVWLIVAAIVLLTLAGVGILWLRAEEMTAIPSDCAGLIAQATVYTNDAERIQALPAYPTSPELIRQVSDDVTLAQGYIDVARAKGCT